MKRVRFIITIAAATLFGIAAQAKEIRISGRIIDGKTGSAPESATLVIRDSRDSVLFAALIESKEGGFDFKSVNIGDGENTLLFTSGFNLHKSIVINGKNAGRHIELGVIALEETIEVLDEVKVEAVQGIERKAGRDIYGIDTSYYRGVVNSADLLRKIPLVTVSSTGQSASITGKGNTLVMINGINTGQSIDLRRVNYRDVEKVEVITLPPSNIDNSYDGVINIILKKEVRQGYEAGFDEMLRIPSGDNDIYAGFAYGTDKAKVEFLYTNYYRNTKLKTYNTRTDTETGLAYKMDGKSDSGFERDHTFNVNFDWHISPNDYFNITTQTDLSASNKHYDYEQVYTDATGDIVLTDSPLKKKLGYDYTIGNYTMHYRHTLRNKRTDWLALTGNFGFTKGHDDSWTKYETSGKEISAVENSDRKSGSLVLNYNGEFAKFLTVNAGVQGFLRNLRSDINGETQVGNNYSNYQYNIFADFSMDWKKTGVTIGLKGEGYTNEYHDSRFGSNSFYAFLPSFAVLRKFDNKNSLELSYRKTAVYPSAWTLVPYTIVYDDKTSLSGNPDLKPEYQHYVALTYSYRGENLQFNTGPGYAYVYNMWARNQTLDEDLNTVRKTVNAGSITRFLYYFGGRASIGEWLDLNPFAQVYYDIVDNTIGTRREGLQCSLSLSASVYFPHYITLYSDVSYRSRTLSMTGRTLPSYSISTVNLRKNFPSLGTTLTLSYWMPLTSATRSEQYFDDYKIRDYFYRTNATAFMVRLEFYIMSRKQLQRSNVKTYFDTDARSR